MRGMRWQVVVGGGRRRSGLEGAHYYESRNEWASKQRKRASWLGPLCSHAQLEFGTHKSRRRFSECCLEDSYLLLLLAAHHPSQPLREPQLEVLLLVEQLLERKVVVVMLEVQEGEGRSGLSQTVERRDGGK